MSVSISTYLISLVMVFAALGARSQQPNTKPPYSPVRVSNGLLFIAGQTAVSANKGGTAANFDAEVSGLMEQIKRILDNYHLDFSSLVNVTVYLKDLQQYEDFNKIYVSYFKEPLPARSCVAVKDIPHGARIEIAAIAEMKN